MGEKKNTLVQSIIEVACKNDFSQQAKEKAIANLIENHIEDKACQWLIGEFSQKQDRDGRPNIESRSCVSVEELIQDFRKAMEEELWE